MPPQPSPRFSLARMARLQRTFYRFATVALVVGTLYWGQTVLIPVALAVLLAFALTPPAAWLERRGLGRLTAALSVSVVALAVVTGLGWVAGTQIRRLAIDLPKYAENIARKAEPLQHLLEGVERVESFGTPVPVDDPASPPLAPPTDGGKGPISVTVVKPAASQAVEWVTTLAAPAGHTLATFLLVSVLTIFLLSQRESVRDRLLILAGRRRLTTTSRALGDAGRRVSRYLLLQATTNASLGAVIGIGLALIGVPYAPLWGLLSATLRFVPYLGIWLSALFPFALAVAVFPGWWPALLVLGVYVVGDLILSNAIEPLLFGRGTGVSSLALLVAAAFWAFLWGPVGLLLAIPLTVCLVVLGEHVPSLGFLRTLLGDEPQVDPAARYFHRVLAGEFDQAALLVEEQANGRPLLEVYDHVVLPALGQAKGERERGDLTPAEERRFYAATRDVLDGVLAGRRAEAAGQPVRPAVRVVGCSTKGLADRLALTLLRDVALQAGCEVEVVAADRLVAEVQERVGRGEPVSACVATVSPGGLARAAGLCKHLRQVGPQVKVLVGRWGSVGDRTETEKFLRAAGAETVTWSLRETLAAIAPEAVPPPSTPGGVVTPAQPGQVTV